MQVFLNCCTQRGGVKKYVEQLSSQFTLSEIQLNRPKTSCFQCDGTGKIHRSIHNHYEKNCNFCTKCVGCGGTGNIPQDTDHCSKCYGKGRVHGDPNFTHKVDCIFCEPCKTCDKKVWVQKKLSCFQCGGTGSVHRSESRHDEKNCFRCIKCVGCGGIGNIPKNAEQCSECNGEGRIHINPHVRHKADCYHCNPCKTCATKGWVQKKPEKVKLKALGNQTCYKCEGIGKVHDSNIEHKDESCIFCKNCVGCNMTGKISNKASKCKNCHGRGKVHESSLEHTTPGCTFCKDCQECSTKGWV